MILYNKSKMFSEILAETFKSIKCYHSINQKTKILSIIFDLELLVINTPGDLLSSFILLCSFQNRSDPIPSARRISIYASCQPAISLLYSFQSFSEKV